MDATVDLCQNDYDLKRQYDFRNIVIVREYDADFPIVYCEATEIQQVFLNLLKNGAEAMSFIGTQNGNRNDETTGRSKEPTFFLRAKKLGKVVRIEIEDNGPGMDPVTTKRIFEPFFTTKEVGVGTGLGLSVSYFIIAKNHGGNLAVESARGRGTKFVIDLPLR